MEPYHRQPPAERADSKLKTAKKNGPRPPLFQSYRTHLNRAPEKENLYSPATHPRLALI